MLANSKLVTNNLKFQLEKPKTFGRNRSYWKHLQKGCKSPKFQTTSRFAFCSDEHCPNNSKHLPKEEILTIAKNYFLKKKFSTFIFQNKFLLTFHYPAFYNRME